MSRAGSLAPQREPVRGPQIPISAELARLLEVASGVEQSLRADKRANTGMTKAAKKASVLLHGWTASATEELRTWVRAQAPGAEFIIEEARAHLTPMPEGADARAWGKVTQRAMKLGIIAATGGFKRAASSNNSAKPLYCKGPHA